ncbi:hypothetical protein L0Y49_01185 [bacterium]|nr:hypothetical protein [bacterium]MCI0566476.1 hypothetical protein [bacterium]MCI0680171.1 hypothetical protein [bacterium]
MESFKNFFTGITAKYGAYFDKDKLSLSLHPYRDWAFLLIVFLALLAAISIAGVRIFLGISSAGLFIEEFSSEHSELPKVKEDLLLTLEKFEKKSEEFEALYKEREPVLPSGIGAEGTSTPNGMSPMDEVFLLPEL